jgi:alpha-amylase
MLQAFEWYIPADKKHWKRLLGALEGLKATGIDNIWVPPGCKGASQEGNGYFAHHLNVLNN